MRTPYSLATPASPDGDERGRPPTPPVLPLATPREGRGGRRVWERDGLSRGDRTGCGRDGGRVTGLITKKKVGAPPLLSLRTTYCVRAAGGRSARALADPAEAGGTWAVGGAAPGALGSSRFMSRPPPAPPPAPLTAKGTGRPGRPRGSDPRAPPARPQAP